MVARFAVARTLRFPDLRDVCFVADLRLRTRELDGGVETSMMLEEEDANLRLRDVGFLVGLEDDFDCLRLRDLVLFFEALRLLDVCFVAVCLRLRGLDDVVEALVEEEEVSESSAVVDIGSS